MESQDGRTVVRPEAQQTRRTVEEQRFVESFKQYVDLLVEESCNEINGWKPVPKAKFERAGMKLVKASKTLNITQEAEAFVGVADDLARNRLLAPEPGGICSTQSGNSLYRLVRFLSGVAMLNETFSRLEGHFEKMGLTLSASLSDFEGRTIIGMCLGEAKTIDLPVGPKVTVFTKTIIENTCDTMYNRVLGIDVTSDWTNDGGIYLQLEPKLRNGRMTWSDLKDSSSIKTAFNELGLTSSMGEKDKLDELAWTPFLLDSGNKEAFGKKYAVTCIEDNYPHEIYHQQIVKPMDGTSTGEAAAQLYAIERGGNPFNCLRSLYFWKDGKQHKYAHAAEVAFRQLEKAGYKESLWKELDSSDTEKVNAAGSEIRRLAGAALENLETGLNWRSHKDAERELGLERNYSMLHEELEKLERTGGAKYEL